MRYSKSACAYLTQYCIEYYLLIKFKTYIFFFLHQNVKLLTLDDLRSGLKKSPSSENATPQNSSQKEADLNSEYGEQGKDKRDKLD